YELKRWLRPGSRSTRSIGEVELLDLARIAPQDRDVFLLCGRPCGELLLSGGRCPSGHRRRIDANRSMTSNTTKFLNRCALTSSGIQGQSRSTRLIANGDPLVVTDGRCLPEQTIRGGCCSLTLTIRHRCATCRGELQTHPGFALRFIKSACLGFSG